LTQPASTLAPEPTPAPPAARPHLTYQPSLDGVRAAAVLVVMLYHSGPTWFTAGFLGVDVFLVLSGFLITLLLVQEAQGSGTINRGAFWGRRARRLLPAVFAVLVAVALYAAFAATTAEREAIRGDGLASLFYVQNWHLIFAQQSYFAQFGTPSPLRHMCRSRSRSSGT
jgi:peptidoglycan/LPS O-acetylase OafA/YrhL